MDQKINTIDLFKKLYYNKKLIRYDIIVRYIAIQEYIKTKKLHSIFRKDCICRAKFVNSMSDIQVNEGEKRFIKTINSFYIKPYFDKKYPIKVYTNYNIEDGIHRLAAALYMRIGKVNIVIGKGDPFQEDMSKYPDINYYKSIFNNNELNLLFENERYLLGKFN